MTTRSGFCREAYSIQVPASELVWVACGVPGLRWFRGTTALGGHDVTTVPDRRAFPVTAKSQRETDGVWRFFFLKLRKEACGH